MPSSLSLTCPAKLNLALSVGTPRPDHFHPIASWMVALTFGDTLHLRRSTSDIPDPTSHIKITPAPDAPVAQPIDWPIEKDLAYRAHALLQQHVSKPLPIEARIEKRIPAGAGLGGGSSDGAAMLTGLNQLFDLNLNQLALRELAQQLGSDVPFLVAALHDEPSAIVTGLGETLEPAPRDRPIHLVLILPPFACPTAAVYRAFDELNPLNKLNDAGVRALATQYPVPVDGPFNDLAPAACHVQPQLSALLDQIRAAANRPAHVTGSGAAMFVIAADATEAADLAALIKNQTNLTTLATQTLTA